MIDGAMADLDFDEVIVVAVGRKKGLFNKLGNGAAYKKRVNWFTDMEDLEHPISDEICEGDDSH